MSYAIVFYIVGWVLKFESYFLMLPYKKKLCSQLLGSVEFQEYS